MRSQTSECFVKRSILSPTLAQSAVPTAQQAAGFCRSAIAVEQVAEQFVECRLGVFEFLQRGVERLQREL
ncbi:hypothetical protein B0G69_4769 [Paraburkholderia sp. RAU2J]|nr:hypothetical protein B0G69_4769 [Paraburkholderia sp. RAU2J]